MPVQMVVRLDDRWVEMPVEGEEDPGSWAAGLVGAGMAARQLQESAASVSVCTQAWAAALDDLRGRADGDGSVIVTAYGLVPGADMLPVTFVELHATALEAGTDPDDLLGELVTPEEMRFGPPDVTTLTSPAGEVNRLRQLVVIQDARGDQTVATSLAYVWAGPEDGTAVLMTAFFASPMDAEQFSALVDDLASSLTYSPAA